MYAIYTLQIKRDLAASFLFLHSSLSEACIDLAMLEALLARHLAAPFEDAIAVGQLLDHAMLVPPTAA